MKKDNAISITSKVIFLKEACLKEHTLPASATGIILDDDIHFTMPGCSEVIYGNILNRIYIESSKGNFYVWFKEYGKICPISPNEIIPMYLPMN